MKRALYLPMAAAALGVILALTVWAMDPPNHVVQVTDVEEFIDAVEVVDVGEVAEVAPRGLRLHEQVLQEVLLSVREELRVALESDRDLTAEEREEIRRALERVNDRLPVKVELAEILGPEDGSAHRDRVDAASNETEAPDAPAATPEPAKSGGT
jgi:hypothetical protein